MPPRSLLLHEIVISMVVLLRTRELSASPSLNLTGEFGSSVMKKIDLSKR